MGISNVSHFIGMYNRLLAAPEYTIRGQKCKEIENFAMYIPYPFTSLIPRKFSTNYLKKEFLWYLSADPYNMMITDHAQTWKDIQQPNGQFFSNYGQYWFNDTERQCGFDWVIEELRHDRYSRRAVIPMLQPHHLFQANKDVVCTEAISFRIRDGKLNMTVHMRSNDAIWGTSNDVACFWWLQEMVAYVLNIPRGTYKHVVDSLHVYERHYKMLEKLARCGEEDYYHLDYPPIDDVYDLTKQEFHSPFGKWLNNEW